MTREHVPLLREVGERPMIIHQKLIYEDIAFTKSVKSAHIKQRHL